MRNLVSIVIVVVSASCTTCPQPTPCTPEAAGFDSKDAATVPAFTPPDGCALVDDNGAIPDTATDVATTEATREDALEKLYSCSSSPKPPSGVDFAAKKVVFLSAQLGPGASLSSWSTHDARGFHVGVSTGTCGGVPPRPASVAFLVDKAESIDLHPCSTCTICREPWEPPPP